MRDKVIDQLKGLGLLLVIINHVNPIISYGHNIIQAFHVPFQISDVKSRHVSSYASSFRQNS